MKQEDLAQKILVSQSSLSGYENGKFEPDSKTLLKIAEIFHVSVDYLLGGAGQFSKEKAMIRVPVYQNFSSDAKDPILFYYSELRLFQSPDDSFFGLYMETDAMEPRICRGDLIIAHRQSEVQNGSIAVVQTTRENAVVKKLWKMPDGQIVLLSTNAKYMPDIYTHEQVLSLPIQVLGLVVEFHGYVSPNCPASL